MNNPNQNAPESPKTSPQSDNKPGQQQNQGDQGTSKPDQQQQQK